ncbi:MAG: PEP-CTERM sorting domain-containing protein [Phycisphaerae bacterium]
MKTASVLVLIVGFLAFPTATVGGPPPWNFTFTAPGGNIPDDWLGVFPLFMTPDIVKIESIELDIFGLSHDEPQDMDVYLIDPFGHVIEIMTDLGGSTAITAVDLTFSDAGTTLPTEPIMSGMYRPEGLFNGNDLGFATYVGGPGGTAPPAAWILVFIDDAPLGTGCFGSYTLRGTYVPEPVTLTLLALGAFVALRRRRW